MPADPSSKYIQQTRDILDALDLVAEFKSLGVDVTGSQPSATGWIECRAFGREDKNPSAGICIEGELAGRYREFTGEARSLGFFDFAALASPQFSDWKEARKHYAEKAGVKLGRHRQPASPEDQFAWREWNHILTSTWCQMHKKGISPHAVKAAGCRLAGWPKKSKSNVVIAMPIWGPNLLDADPTGYQFWAKSGQKLGLWQGKGQPLKHLKIITAAGSEAGWMNRWALQHLDQAEVVWKVEGAFDCLALQSLIPPELIESHVVISDSGGSLHRLTDEMLAPLVGKNVIVVHDNDEDGQRGGIRSSSQIAEVASTCKHLTLPYPIVKNHGKDMRDWILTKGTYRQLLDLARAAPNAQKGRDGRVGDVVVESVGNDGNAGGNKPEPPTDDSGGKPDAESKSSTPENPTPDLKGEHAICEDLGIDVIGRANDGRAEIYSEEHGATFLRNVPRLTIEDLLQVCGPVAGKKITTGTQKVPGTHNFVDVKKAIALLSGYADPVGSKIGQGCWPGKQDDGHQTESIVLVSDGEGALWNGSGTLYHLPRPRIGGHIMDFQGSGQWFDVQKLQKYLASYRQEQGHAAIDETADLLAKWYWTKKDSHVLVVGLILASWVQTLWQWRPLVSVIGPSDSGKSTLFEFIGALFGNLALLNSKSSEAGIRQAVKTSARVVLCDEFESDRHRKKILELFRTSSRGSTTLRGTADQTGQEYGMRHIPWVAAIELGMAREPDRNRFIGLELKKPPEEVRGNLELPPPEELANLGLRLLAMAIHNVNEAKALADRLKGHTIHGVSGRVVESYAVPVAMLSVATEISYEAAVVMLEKILGTRQTDVESTPDEIELMRTILESRVDLGRGEKATAGQILSDSQHAGWEILIQNGVGWVYSVRGRPAETSHRDTLFVACSTVQRYLLNRTSWEGQSVKQILQRFPGATYKQRVFGGRKVWGIDIGREYVESMFLKDGEMGEEGGPGSF